MTVRELMAVVNKIEDLANRLETSEKVSDEDKAEAIMYLKNYATDLSNININMQ